MEEVSILLPENQVCSICMKDILETDISFMDERGSTYHTNCIHNLKYEYIHTKECNHTLMFGTGMILTIIFVCIFVFIGYGATHHS